MDYGPSDSSGTDDDLPPSHNNRSARFGHVTRNGRPVPGGNSYVRVQNDMESQIHQLEQDAYSSVLRAFKAQSDAITWEKEGLITELRKELRVSDDEHRDLLSRVNADEIIRGIREWRQSGGFQCGFLNNSLPNHDTSLIVSTSHKRQRISQPVGSLPLGVPPPSLHSQPIIGTMQASSAVKRGGSGVRGNKTKLPLPAAYTHAGLSEGDQVVNRGSGSIATMHPAEGHYVPLIGRKVMTRWPDDNNFYEAVISDYDTTKGLHRLTYDINTPNESVEWVNLEEISTEDIRWEGEDPHVAHRSIRGGLGRGVTKSRGGAVPLGGGRGRGFLLNQRRNDFPPLLNGAKRKNIDEIEILNTETLIKEVENVLDTTHPDASELEKAKKLLKEHEESLLDAISRLADASDGESEDGGHHLSNGQQPLDQDRCWRNEQGYDGEPIVGG